MYTKDESFRVAFSGIGIYTVDLDVDIPNNIYSRAKRMKVMLDKQQNSNWYESSMLGPGETIGIVCDYTRYKKRWKISSNHNLEFVMCDLW